MNPHRIALATVIAACLALSGCGKSPSQSAAEAAVAAATGGKMQVNKNGDQSQVTIKDDKGNQVQMNTGGNVALPKDFPTDVHLPATYTIKTAMSMSGGSILELHTPTALQAVYAEYDTSMKSGGWTEAMAMQSATDGATLQFTKDKRTAVVVITAHSEGGSDVHLQIASDQ